MAWLATCPPNSRPGPSSGVGASHRSVPAGVSSRMPRSTRGDSGGGVVISRGELIPSPLGRAKFVTGGRGPGAVHGPPEHLWCERPKRRSVGSLCTAPSTRECHRHDRVNWDGPIGLVSGAMTAKRFLLVCHDAGGTVPPVLALAESLLENGHDVSILSQPSVRGRAQELGCAFLAFSRLPNYEQGKPLEEQIELTLPALTGKSVGDDVVAATGDLEA